MSSGSVVQYFLQVIYNATRCFSSKNLCKSTSSFLNYVSHMKTWQKNQLNFLQRVLNKCLCNQYHSLSMCVYKNFCHLLLPLEAFMLHGRTSLWRKKKINENISCINQSRECEDSSPANCLLCKQEDLRPDFRICVRKTRQIC